MDKTLSEVGRLLSASQSVVISTHVLPDGDGLGAEIALYHYLRRIGKEVRIVNPDAPPERYRFLDKTGAIEVLGDGERPWKKYDLALVVDTHEPHRVGAVWAEFEKYAREILFLDHHPHDGRARESAPHKDTLRVHVAVDEKSSSIGEMLYRLFHQSHDLLDPHSASFRLSPEIALGLYVSIITDTNSFRYARTTALSHRIAADLIDYGLEPEAIYQEVYSSKTIQHLRLIGEVLARVDQTPEGRVAWVEIPLALRKKFGASGDDTQSIVNFLLVLKDPEVLALLREEDDGRIKGSLKSKGSLAVNDVASEFGGGGHEYAAGFVTEGKLEEVRKKLVSRLRERYNLNEKPRKK